MLRKLLLISAISSSALMSPIAKADTSEPGFYFTAGVGTGLNTDIEGTINGTNFTSSGRTTFAGGLGLGYDFDTWRVEAAVTRATAEIDSVGIGTIAYDVDESATGTGFSIGIAYDFENDSRFTPFIGGSYQMAWSDDADDSSNSYGLDLGLSTPVSDDIEFWTAIGIGYSPEQTIDSVNFDAATAWGFSTGLRVRI